MVKLIKTKDYQRQRGTNQVYGVILQLSIIFDITMLPWGCPLTSYYVVHVTTRILAINVGTDIERYT